MTTSKFFSSFNRQYNIPKTENNVCRNWNLLIIISEFRTINNLWIIKLLDETIITLQPNEKEVIKSLSKFSFGNKNVYEEVM